MNRNAPQLAVAGLVACAQHGPDPPGSDSSTSPTEVEVSCEQPGDNVLRWSCAVTVDPPQAGKVVAVPTEGGRALAVDLAAATGPVSVPLRFLRTLTEYTVTVTAGGVEAATVFTTSDAPLGARLTYAVDGTSSVPYLVHASPCAYANHVVVSDTEGALVWYESLGWGPEAILRMVQLTEDDTLLAVADGNEPGTNMLSEIDWDGNVLLHVGLGEHYSAPLHHDAFKRHGLTYALFHENVVLDDGLTYKEDGYYVFDSSGAQVQEWRLFDHFLPPAVASLALPPQAIDLSHANSIHVGEDLQVMLSLRFLSAVASVQGDPTQPDYGAITWRLGGNKNEPAFGSDFELTASAGDYASFVWQHHAVPDGPDRLTMFDNRGFLPDRSRVLGITLDHTQGIADIDEVYPLEQHCNFQGGVFFTDEGNPIATCAKPRKVYEWDAGVPEPPRYTMIVSCADGEDTFVGRFAPLDR
jgi:hypothetical protein